MANDGNGRDEGERRAGAPGAWMWRWLLALVMACLSCSEEAGPPARPDVFLISVDTLRADRLGAYGSPRGLTPRLDAWAAESLVFEHAYAPAPLTLPSVVSLLTGRHPLVTGVTSNLGIVPMAVPNLAERLQEAGWRTGAVVSNFALRRATALDRGFEAYDDRFNAVELNRDQPERAAADTRAAALALFDSLRAEGSTELRVRLFALRVRDAASGVSRLRAVINERIEGELLAQVLEEVLLFPAFEHPVRDLDGSQVGP